MIMDECIGWMWSNKCPVIRKINQIRVAHRHQTLKKYKAQCLSNHIENMTQFLFLLQRQCGPLRRLPSRWRPSLSPTRRRIASGWLSARRCATPPSAGSCAVSSTGRIWRAWRPPVPAFRRIWWPRPSLRWEQEARKEEKIKKTRLFVIRIGSTRRPFIINLVTWREEILREIQCCGLVADKMLTNNNIFFQRFFAYYVLKVHLHQFS